MSKPTSNLDWGGTQVEPSSGAKSAGYATGARPTAQHLNWIFGNVDEWLKYLDEQNGLLFGKIAGIVQPNADAPLIGTLNTSFDHPSSASNAWKETLKFAIADGTFARMLVGDGAGAMWALTANAKWNPASGAQNWSHDDPTKPAYILWLSGIGILLTGSVPASGGPSTWTSWGPATFASEGGVIADAYDYYNPVSRTVALQHFEAQPLLFFGADEGWYPDSARITATLASDKCRIPIRLPHGAVLSSVEVIVDQATSTGISFDVLRNSAPNYTTPAAGSQTTLKTATGNSSTGVKKISLTAINQTVDNADEFYLLATAGGIGDKILGARVTFTDPGPRNY